MKNQINPSLSTPKKTTSTHQTRKIRSDKLHDIKIPVPEKIVEHLTRLKGKEFGGSITKEATKIFNYSLTNLVKYEEYPYKTHVTNVRINVTQEQYEELMDYAASFGVRFAKQAAYRIFINGYIKLGYGGYVDEIL